MLPEERFLSCFWINQRTLQWIEQLRLTFPSDITHLTTSRRRQVVISLLTMGQLRHKRFSGSDLDGPGWEGCQILLDSWPLLLSPSETAAALVLGHDICERLAFARS